MQLEKLPCSHHAIYNHFGGVVNLTRNKCTPNTRVNILKGIRKWAKDPDSPPVYWLSGPAGTGKSTIGYTIAEEFDEESHRILAGTFFCSRQLEDTRRREHIIPTLASQMARRSRSFAEALLATDMFDSVHVVSKQTTDLLINPWKESAAKRQEQLPPFLIVIDALDEIDNQGGSEFLRDLLQTINENGLLGLKFLVTSRQDPDIVQLCGSFKSKEVCHLHEVNTEEVKEDIMTFLADKLPALQAEPDLADFAERSDGLFIYAATGVRYLSPSQSRLSPAEQRRRLKKLLKGLPQSNRGQEASLVDTLYQQIFSSARGELEDDEFQTRLDILHAILCARTRVSASTLAELLDSPENSVDISTVESVVQSLYAVLYISANDNCIYWYHASFQDFVFSPQRSRFTIPGKQQTLDVSCDQPSFHSHFANHCFRIMGAQLRFNICNLPSSFLLDSEVDGLERLVREKISEALRYSCRYWGPHLVQATNGNPELNSAVRCFLHDRLLFWIEAMNLIGSRGACEHQLRDVAQWLGKVRSSATYQIFIA